MGHWTNMYGRFISAYMKQQLEYRFAFFGDILVNMITFVSLYLGFWVIFNQFNQLGGWNYYEIVFLYNLNLFSYALSSIVLWSPLKQLEDIVRTGQFDNYLTRPIPPLRLLIMRQFSHTFIGHIVLSVVVFTICMTQLQIKWGGEQIFFFVCVIIGATLIHSAIIIATASTAFWIVRSGSIVDIAIYAIRGYINYPISIYSKGTQIFLTFILPYAFVNYYPSSILLNKSSVTSYALLQYGTPFVGVILLLLACFVFYSGVKRYESTGS